MDELMEMELDGPEMEGKGKKVFAAGHACVCNPLKKPHYPKDWYVLSLLLLTPHVGPHREQKADSVMRQGARKLRLHLTTL